MPRDYRGETPTYDDYIGYSRYEDTEDQFYCEGSQAYYPRNEVIYLAGERIYISKEWILLATEYQLWKRLGAEPGNELYEQIQTIKNQIYAEQNSQSN
jgi:hypothetical protein